MSKSKKTTLNIGNKLDSLIPQKVERGTHIVSINIANVLPNKDQPRKQFEEMSIRLLADSIEEFGLLQPVTVVKKGEHYELIAGERRWRAMQLLKRKEIDAIVKDYDDAMSAKMALIENLQREDLNAIDEAVGYRHLKETYQISQEELSKMVGKSRSHIANYLRMLHLEDYIQSAVRDGKITAGHARALLAIEDGEKRREVFKRIIENEYSVREVEKIVNELSGRKKEKKKEEKNKKKAKSREDADLLRLERELTELLHTKVKIEDKKGKGKLVIEYYSLDEFERILEWIQSAGK